jgi:translation initiation factor IF-3
MLAGSVSTKMMSSSSYDEERMWAYGRAPAFFVPECVLNGRNLLEIGKYTWRWQIISTEHLINEEIRAKEVRLIGSNGDQLGIKPFREALQIAQDAGLDLVNVAPTAKPPVCRIMDYGKYRYEMQKKEKEARKNQKIVEVKEVRFSATIDEHDFQTKLRNVIKFLKDGDKVKMSVRFRGREIAHAEIGQKVLERVAAEVEELAIVERKPKLEGRSMIMILSPKPQ